MLSSIVLVTLKGWVVLRHKLNYTHTNVGAKVQPHQPSLLIVFPNQILKLLRFIQDCGVCILSRCGCKLSCENSTGTRRFFGTLTCIQPHPSSPQCPGSHKRSWTTVATSCNSWLYWRAPNHGPLQNQNITTLPGFENVKTFSTNSKYRNQHAIHEKIATRFA